ncbi:MAG: hypothetical protein GF392_02480, partial [Candidatus Omnitrophica bacterium]|nr:hypothetical protein [Candidatus Omnitrophota bacterium]
MKIFRIIKELFSGLDLSAHRQTPDRAEDELLAMELQRRKHKRLFKGLTWMVIFIFVFQQTGFSGDMIKFSYERSPVADLLSGEREIERMNGMSAPYLIRAHRKHEQIIRSKNLVEEDMRLLLDNRSDKRGTVEDAPLKKKDGTSSGSDKRIEYTLSDYDDSDEPQQISVYSYDKGDEALKSVVSYDLRREENEWDRDDLEDVSDEDLPLVMASYHKGDYSRLTDTLKVTETVYFGKRSEEKVDYVLSDFRNGKATSVSLYVYEKDRILKEVNTYDIAVLAEPFSQVEWKRHIAENPGLWRADVKSRGRLTRRTVYEGAEGEENIVYSLSEYDGKAVPGRVECYDYSGGTMDGALTDVRAYNIKGSELGACLEDLREDRREYDHILKTKAMYTGEKDRERIDHIFGSYYRDDEDGIYRPASRTEYVYRDSTGRMERTETYCVRDGARILRRCSEFTGLRGYEDLVRRYEYEQDGKTLNSVSVFKYDLPVDSEVPHTGGDDDIYTLDRVTEYKGTDDPHDLSDAYVKTETYYDGVEDGEYVSLAFGFDMNSGDTVTRTEYDRRGEVLERVNTYRLTDPSAGYGLGTGKLVSLSVFEGEKDLEKVRYTESYDLAGTLLTRTDHSYASDGRLTDTVTSDDKGNEVSVTRYEGGEDLEKRYLSIEYDLSGGQTSRSEYTYSIIDSLQTVFTFGPDGDKVSRSSYTGVPGEENIVSSVRYDRRGEIIGTTEYLYEAGDVLTGTVVRNDRGVTVSGTVYEGPEGYERVLSAETFDLREDDDPLKKVLKTTEYIYAKNGGLVKTITVDSAGNRLSESLFEGVMGNERVRSNREYNDLGEELTRILYEYGESGALKGTVARSVPLGGMTLTRSCFEGVKGFETIDKVVNNDRDGKELSRVNYAYDGSGAISRTLMTGSDGTELSRTIYRGTKDNEKVDRVERLDLSGDVLTLARYCYSETGSLEKIVTGDTEGNRFSETDHEGDMGRERAVASRTYDRSGGLLTSTVHSYGADGALVGTVTEGYTAEDRSEKILLSRTEYEGARDLELACARKEYDRSGELLRVTDHVYASDGSLVAAETRGADGAVYSATEYSGRMGREKIEDVTEYDGAGEELTRTEYEYASDGAIDRTVVYNDADTLLSVTGYAGRKGREKIEEVTEYDGAGEELTRTEYEYASDGAIDRTHVY